DQVLAPHFTEQRIERAFLRGKLRGTQALENVGDVNAFHRHNAEDQKLQQSFADGAKLSVDVVNHYPKLPCNNKVVGYRQNRQAEIWTGNTHGIAARAPIRSALNSTPAAETSGL